MEDTTPNRPLLTARKNAFADFFCPASERASGSSELP